METYDDFRLQVLHAQEVANACGKPAPIIWRNFRSNIKPGLPKFDEMDILKMLKEAEQRILSLAREKLEKKVAW